jgi:hypothetical protein
MKAFSKVGLLVAVALLASAAIAASAQAVDINPPDTEITGIADNPTLNYGSNVVTCDSGFATGTTPSSGAVVNVDIDFDEPCSLQPVNLQATADCNDGALTELTATNATTNDGEVTELLSGFQCRVVVAGICTLTVNPQTLSANNDADLIGEGTTPGTPSGNEAIDADVDVLVNNNNSLCGPVPSGTGGFAGVYEIQDGVPLRFD